MAADDRDLLESLGLDAPSPVLIVCGEPSHQAAGEGTPGSEAIGHAVAAAARGTGAVVLDSAVDARVNVQIGAATAIAGEMPVAALLAGSGAAAQAAAAAVVARGWPLLVVSDSGEVSDWPAGGRVDVVSVVDGGGALTRRLIWALHPDDVLKDAWRLFATYDQVAVRLRSTFERFQISILLLGVIATLLALLHQELGTQVLRWAVIIASIAVGALIALTGRRGTGKRWVVTRAAGESVKAEIFRYRTRTGAYARAHLPGGDETRPELLAARLEKIQSRLMHSEASTGSLAPYEGPLPPDGGATGDDGLEPLEPERYLELRVVDQIRYYHAHLKVLERRRTALQTLAIVASGAGALVAAVGAETWVALTAAVSAAPLAYLAHLQVDSTIVANNQSAARLEGAQRHWHSRPPRDRTPELFGELVSETEAVMTAERGGWVEQMTEALRELQSRQRKQRSAEQ